jgi:hypothetical protein
MFLKTIKVNTISELPLKTKVFRGSLLILSFIIVYKILTRTGGFTPQSSVYTAAEEPVGTGIYSE